MHALKKELHEPCQKGQLLNYLIEQSKLILLNDGTSACLTAPGEDGVSYAILKGLRRDIQSKISEMLNEVFLTEPIPERWRNTEIKPILKQKANPITPESKRPISLMNVNLKLINSVIKDRLIEIIEIEKLFPRLSFGFRKNCSSVTCVTYLVNQIKTYQNLGRISVGVFLDMSQAFDSVGMQILVETLHKMSIPNKIVSWLHTYQKTGISF